MITIIKSNIFLKGTSVKVTFCNQLLNCNLQFFAEACVRVCGVPATPVPAHCGSGVEEVDSEVGVVALDRLRDVLDDRDVERNGDAEDGQNDRLVFLVWKLNSFVET